MKKVILFAASFLLGMYLFLPYDLLYRRAIESAAPPLEFEIRDASALRVEFSRVSAGIGGRSLTLDDVAFEATPLRYLFTGALGRLSAPGMVVSISRKGDSLDIVFDVRDFRNRAFGEASITLGGHLLIGGDQIREGRIELLLKDLTLPAARGGILLEEVSGSGDIENGRLTIKDLTVKGPLDLSASGTVLLNYRVPELSMLDILVKYKMGAFEGTQKLKGTVKKALASLNTVTALPGP